MQHVAERLVLTADRPEPERGRGFVRRIERYRARAFPVQRVQGGLILAGGQDHEIQRLADRVAEAADVSDGRAKVAANHVGEFARRGIGWRRLGETREAEAAVLFDDLAQAAGGVNADQVAPAVELRRRRFVFFLGLAFGFDLLCHLRRRFVLRGERLEHVDIFGGEGEEPALVVRQAFDEIRPAENAAIERNGAELIKQAAGFSGFDEPRAAQVRAGECHVDVAPEHLAAIEDADFGELFFAQCLIECIDQDRDFALLVFSEGFAQFLLSGRRVGRRQPGVRNLAVDHARQHHVIVANREDELGL